jgi:hypothetical protein
VISEQEEMKADLFNVESSINQVKNRDLVENVENKHGLPVSL